MKKYLMATAIAMSATPASAFCFQSTGYDTSSFIDGALDYLICLHNEQNDALNDQARIINSQSDIITSLNQTITLMDSDLFRAEQRIADLEMQLGALQSLVYALDRKVAD